ncbi:hypothetical protein D3C83_23000 [compost metagenome]
MEHEVHLGGPAADAFYLRQFPDQDLVIQRGPARGLKRAVPEFPGEVFQIAGFLAGQAAAAQRRRAQAGQGFRRYRTEPGYEPVPYALRRFHRYLLADDGAGERGERIAAAAEREALEAPDQFPQHRVAFGQFLRGSCPVFRCSHA